MRVQRAVLAQADALGVGGYRRAHHNLPIQARWKRVPPGSRSHYEPFWMVLTRRIQFWRQNKLYMCGKIDFTSQPGSDHVSDLVLWSTRPAGEIAPTSRSGEMQLFRLKNVQKGRSEPGWSTPPACNTGFQPHRGNKPSLLPNSGGRSLARRSFPSRDERDGSPGKFQPHRTVRV
jgi:hypothetical protein